MTLAKNFMVLTMLQSGEITRVDFETVEAARQVFKLRPLATVVFSELIDIRGDADVVLDTYAESQVRS